MCSKFPLSNGLQYWLHPLYRLQFALSNDFVLAATCVSMFYSYCYPTVYYTGYIYSLSNDFLLTATCVSILIVTVIQRCTILATIIRYPTTLYWRQYMCPFFLISVIQRFRNTGDTIYTKLYPHFSNSRFFCVIQRISFPIIPYLHAPPPPLPVF